MVVNDHVSHARGPGSIPGGSSTYFVFLTFSHFRQRLNQKSAEQKYFCISALASKIHQFLNILALAHACLLVIIYDNLHSFFLFDLF